MVTESDPDSAELAESETSRGSLFFPNRKFVPFAPNDILTSMRSRIGFSVSRTLASTALIALTFGLMRAVPSMLLAAFVIPLWCAAVGVLVDGKRGALRGIIVAMVYPAYFALIVAFGALIFWVYAILHQAVCPNQILW